MTRPSRFKYHPGDRLGPSNILMMERTKRGSNGAWYGKFLCPRHEESNIVFEARIDSIVNGSIRSCGCLNRETSSIVGKNVKKDLIGQKFGHLTVIEDTGNRTPAGHNVIWLCKCDCNAESLIEVPSSNLTNGHTSSCGCDKQSRGAKKVALILQQLNLYYETEKKFEGCINKETKMPLRFDFYLPDYNACIEYDGEQHYFGWSHDLNSLKINQYRDEIKNQYCAKHGIKLIRIPYWDYDKLDTMYILKCLMGEEDNE